MRGIDGKVLTWSPKRQILIDVLQNCEKSTVNHSIEKPMLLNFVVPRLSKETYFHF